jgi:hypothetical protein
VEKTLSRTNLCRGVRPMNPCTNNMSTSKKRSRPAEDPDSISIEDGNDAAAEYNQRVLRRVQRALAREPDIDITTVLPSQYTSRLAGKKPSLCVEATCGKSAVSAMHLLSVSHNPSRRSSMHLTWETIQKHSLRPAYGPSHRLI